jgi:hypothetical protein
MNRNKLFMSSTFRSFSERLYKHWLDAMHRPLRKRGTDPYHHVFQEFRTFVQRKDSPSILEIGSRNVTGVT